MRCKVCFVLILEIAVVIVIINVRAVAPIPATIPPAILVEAPPAVPVEVPPETLVKIPVAVPVEVLSAILAGAPLPTLVKTPVPRLIPAQKQKKKLIAQVFVMGIKMLFPAAVTATAMVTDMEKVMLLMKKIMGVSKIIRITDTHFPGSLYLQGFPLLHVEFCI